MWAPPMKEEEEEDVAVLNGDSRERAMGGNLAAILFNLVLHRQPNGDAVVRTRPGSVLNNTLLFAETGWSRLLLPRS